MKILVTGGAGYIGSTLVRNLVIRDVSVFLIDNFYRGISARVLKHINISPSNFMIIDIRNKSELEQLFAKKSFNTIIHLAAIPGLRRCKREPLNAITTNIFGTYNLLELARKFDVDSFIFASTAAVYGIPVKTPVNEEHPLNPINLYGITKLAGEKLVKSYNQTYGLNTIIFRFGNVYGVGLYTYWETIIPKFVKQALSDQPLTIYGNGNQTRDFVHVFDVVQAIKLALSAPRSVIFGEVFNVASGKPTSIKEIANIVSEVVKSRLNKKIKIVYLPPRRDEPYLKDFCLSIEKIKSKLGFRPRWTIREGVNQLVDYFLNNYK